VARASGKVFKGTFDVPERITMISGLPLDASESGYRSLGDVSAAHLGRALERLLGLSFSASGRLHIAKFLIRQKHITVVS